MPTTSESRQIDAALEMLHDDVLDDDWSRAERVHHPLDLGPIGDLYIPDDRLYEIKRPDLVTLELPAELISAPVLDLIDTSIAAATRAGLPWRDSRIALHSLSRRVRAGDVQLTGRLHCDKAQFLVAVSNLLPTTFVCQDLDLGDGGGRAEFREYDEMIVPQLTAGGTRVAPAGHSTLHSQHQVHKGSTATEDVDRRFTYVGFAMNSKTGHCNSERWRTVYSYDAISRELLAVRGSGVSDELAREITAQRRVFEAAELTIV